MAYGATREKFGLRMSRNMLRYKAIARAAMLVDTPEYLST